jgi:methionyl-tRNA synthetase
MSAQIPSRLYLTTPIYYVNDIPHIGHTYTTVLADVICRFHALMGSETFFLTGTDEHGQKVQQAAQKRGVDPQEHVDTYNVRFRDLWTRMNIRYDHFIRTTDSHHKEYVRSALQFLWDKGEIYSDEYAGWYSVSEERFFSEEELVDGKDPISGKAVEWIVEKNYFFKMSKYQQRLLDHLEQNPDYILPDFRRNEVLGFLKQPLQDLCISRPKSRLAWGIPLPFDEDYVTYVWFDALLNYASGVDQKSFAEGPMWPADYHLIGKDILTTHAVYWSTMLMGLEWPMPKHILAHGWWLNGGAKMSKSTGTAINPIPYVDQFGVDAVRYYLMRDMVVGQDSSFTDDSFVRRLNSELANDLGNGLNRVYKLAQTHFDGQLPSPVMWEAEEEELRSIAEAAIHRAQEHIVAVRISQALEETCGVVRAVNRYLEIRAPWKLAKDPASQPLLATTLAVAGEALRLVFHLLQPVMPTKAIQGLELLGATFAGVHGLQWNAKPSPRPLGEHAVLFPRIEITKEEIPVAQEAEARLDLRVAQITEVSDHPNADALYVLQVQDGQGLRQVCAGLKKSYSPADLLNRHVVLLANLKPAKLRGLESAGMLLAGDGPDGKALLLEPGNIPLGTTLSWGELKTLPAPQVTLKDLEPLAITVQGHMILCQGRILSHQDLQVLCPAADGAAVK